MDSKMLDNYEIKRIFDELSDLIITARKNVEKVINHELDIFVLECRKIH
jgi:hypothetical protein